MALNARRLQRQRERSLGRSPASSPTWPPERAAVHPVHECYLPASLDRGIGQAIFSRRLPDGDVAVACFLVDTWCLGVKDAFLRVLPPGEFRRLVSSLAECERASPARVRKLVEDAVEYARGHGLEPHPDYHHARKLFGDVDPSECAEEFVFGRDGKPLYAVGPNDTPARIRAVRRALDDRCGPCGWHFIAPTDLAEMLER